MEKKTIGGFIAALRKANGMTQKDLAARLNVSDKTVSRWECDDGAPDLSVIPVLAEIFGVSCDELLRGARKSPVERAGQAEGSENSSKTEKQRRRLLKTTLSQYQNHSYIAMGVSAVGVIAALICDLAFLKAVLGFLVAAIFFVAGIVCQAIFVNRALSSVEDAELDAAVLAAYKRKVISLAQKSIGLTLGFIGFTFPLVLAPDAHLGLRADSLLLWGFVGAAAFLLVYAVVLHFLNASRLKKDADVLSEKEAAVYHHNYKLRNVCGVLLIFLLLVTLTVHEMATSIYGPYSIMEGTVFDDYAHFITCMEQDVPRSQRAGDASAPEREIASPITYYDKYGNEISAEQAKRRELKDKNGTVVCTYTARNENVCRLFYTPQDGTVLPITVCTYDDLYAAQAKADARSSIFVIAYCAEFALVLALYFLKRKRCAPQ